jgi:cytochrome c peroxidase
LLSNIQFHRIDGLWIAQTNWSAYISAREGKTRFTLPDVPIDPYDSVRFNIGVPPEVNHKSVAEYPANHPLNPDVNGLYWGWMGGYVFLALEGDWRRPDGAQSGYSYHLATDRQLMTVELPVEMDLAGDSEMRLVLNVGKFFTGPNQIALTEITASTHSRTNDLLADQLRRNVESAFTVERISSSAVVNTNSVTTNHIEMAANATPYRLTISAYFPRPALPADNPLTEEGVALGKRLFFDKRFSINNSQACADCHKPGEAFTDGKSVSTGAEGDTGTRNAMSLFNLAWKSSFFWDGRAATLREQVLQPIQNPIEMHESLTNVAAKLAADKDYPTAFAKAFGVAEITPDRIARALEQFLLTQISYESKFDRVIAGEAKLSAEEQRGFELFHTEYDPGHGQFGADCFHCHGGPLFQSQNFANNGLDAHFTDLGRYRATGRDGDQGKFAVPSLRNVEVTGPYMHDGRFRTLEEVVEHYCTGVRRSATLDPNLGKHPDGGVPLNAADKRALVAFLKTLTDERFRGQGNDAVVAGTR